jgi:hypothetical protein
MARVTLQILAIDVQIPALLLDHEYFGAQAQYRVKLFFVEIGVMFANPVDRHVTDLKKNSGADTKASSRLDAT